MEFTVSKLVTPLQVEARILALLENGTNSVDTLSLWVNLNGINTGTLTGGEEFSKQVTYKMNTSYIPSRDKRRVQHQSRQP
jgi:hypothetical protein